MKVLDGKSRSEKETESLLTFYSEGVLFSKIVPLLLLYHLGPATLEELTVEMSKIRDTLRNKNEKFYFNFGSDCDPHSPRGLTIEDILFRHQELGRIGIRLTSEDKYSLTYLGNAYLLDSIIFMKGFGDKIEKNYGWVFIEKYLKKSPT